ncbi:MAG: hypothetical protein MI924_31375 [Chloroflexales bacterium]|nr:hypothetical protein [Chloroflexales bacterium]
MGACGSIVAALHNSLQAASQGGAKLDVMYHRPLRLEMRTSPDLLKDTRRAQLARQQIGLYSRRDHSGLQTVNNQATRRSLPIGWFHVLTMHCQPAPFFKVCHFWSSFLNGGVSMFQKMFLLVALLIALSACSLLPRDYEPARFTVSGETAVMTGVIDSTIQESIERLLAENPQVTTIVMQDVEGSVDDDANLIAARYVREQGLHTHIPHNGLVASGGTDFFLAGVKRTAESGAQIGVHSWAGGSVAGSDLPKDHPEHKKYLDYYNEMGVPTEFYWFTLQAASSEEMHWMSAQEQQQYHITTQ